MRSLWPLPGTGSGRPALWVSAGLVLLVALTRLAFLPDGPWEQDEALFATGVLDFDAANYRPHPPGFPGWIAMGMLVHLVVGDPLLALRLVSIACSVGTMVVLAGLLPRAGLRAPVALMAALLYSVLPGVWAHSARAFSTTPALFFLTLATWSLQAGGVRRLAYLGWASLAWGLAIRPQFLVFAPLVLIVASPRRWWAERRGWGPPLLGGAVLAAAGAWLVWQSGGLEVLLAATVRHGRVHFEAVRPVEVSHAGDLGFVRGLGGLLPALLWGAAATLGSVRLWRAAGRVVATWVLGTAAVAVGLVWFLSGAYLPRHAPVLLLATLPVAALGVQRLAGRWTVGTLAVLSVLAALSSVPAVQAMSHGPLPVVAALRGVAREPEGATLLYAQGAFSFARLERDLGHVGGPIYQMPGNRVSNRAFFRMLGRRGRPILRLDLEQAVLPGLTVQRRLFGGMPPSAWRLSQHRFDRAEIVERAPVWLYGRYGIERPPGEEPFGWLAPRSGVWLQGGSRGVVLALRISEWSQGMQSIVVTEGGRELVRRRLAGRDVLVRVPVDDCGEGCELDLELSSARLERRGGRRLAARLYATWLIGFPTAPYAVSPAAPEQAFALGATLHGFHAPEAFRRSGRRGAWSSGPARVDLVAGRGVLRVEMGRPADLAGPVTLRTAAGVRTCEAGPVPTVCEVPVDGGDERTSLSIEAATFVPAEITDSPDTRELGVIVYSVGYLPAAALPGEPSLILGGGGSTLE